MVAWVPDWPVHCLVVDLPPGGTGAVVHSERIEVASAAARSAGVRSGMSVREATYVCPDLICLPRDPDRERERLAPLSMLSIQWRPGWSACAPG